MDLQRILFKLERELADGDGDTYRRLLADDAVVVVPGPRLDKDATAQPMDASSGCDAISFDDEAVTELTTTPHCSPIASAVAAAMTSSTRRSSEASTSGTTTAGAWRSSADPLV
jgi:hypothetical protein